MKRIFAAAAGIAVLGLATSAVAADLPPAQPYRVAPAVAAPYFSWTGLYAGFNGGYATGRTSDFTGARADMKGAIAGGQLGWQLQTGMFVGGFEGDFQASWQSYSVTGTFNGVTLTAKEEVPWFGTIRARAGLAFDRSLLYLTGGAAYTNFKLSASGPLASSSSHGSRVAWTAGGGWEYMFWERWSGKVEYLYIDTGDVTMNLAGLPVSGSLRNHIVRGGINFHF